MVAASLPSRKTMHRFYLPPDECRGTSLMLRGREAHHALHVLRVREGERVTVLNGVGSELQCEITGQMRGALPLRVLNRKVFPAPLCAITLLQAIPKGKIMESIIQKATELGVSRIVPILSERVVTQVDAAGAEAKGHKWQQVAMEAIKQCGSAWLPKVEAPLALKEFMARGERFELALV